MRKEERGISIDCEGIETSIDRNQKAFDDATRCTEGFTELSKGNLKEALLLGEHLKIAPEGHASFVVMKELRDFWRGGPVRAQKLLLLVSSHSQAHRING